MRIVFVGYLAVVYGISQPLCIVYTYTTYQSIVQPLHFISKSAVGCYGVLQVQSTSSEHHNLRKSRVPPPFTTTVYITHRRGGCQRSTARQPRGCPLPNDTSSESSWRGVFNDDLFWHRHYSNCADIDHKTSAQGGVIYAVVYGIPIHLTIARVW